MLRRSTLVAVAIALVVPLAACAEQTRIPDAEPSSDVAPLFASDEEALAAAAAAYEEYLATVDGALRDGATGSSPFTNVAAGAALQDAEETLANFVEEELRVTGERVLTAAILQQTTAFVDEVEVQLYVCESVEGVGVFDVDGNSLVEPQRPDLTAFEAVVVIGQGSALVHQRQVWSGDGVCAN